jgi:hypothetical protein
MASQNNVRSFHIVNGPSKFDLMVSLFEGNPKHRRTVSFALEGIREEMQVGITAVEQESGGGESWNWQGNLHNDKGARYRVKGYFGTKGRTGHFNFVVPFSNQWDDKLKTYVEKIDPMEERILDQYLADLKR